MGQEGSAGPDPCTTLPHFSLAVMLLHLTLHRRAGSAVGRDAGTRTNKIEFLALLGVTSLLRMMGVGQGYGWAWA